MAFLIDQRFNAAAASLAICAILALFGFIHSVLPSGGIYLPWRVGSNLPYHWSIAYAALAGMILVLGGGGGRQTIADS